MTKEGVSVHVFTDNEVYNHIKKYQKTDPSRYSRYNKRYTAAKIFRKDKKAAAMSMLIYDMLIDNV